MTGLERLLAEATAEHAADCIYHDMPIDRICHCGKREAQRAIEDAAYDTARLVLDMADALAGVVNDAEALEHPRAPSVVTRGQREHMASLLARVAGIGNEQ